MLIITTSPSTSAVSTDGLREMMVASSTRAASLPELAAGSACIRSASFDQPRRSLFPPHREVEMRHRSRDPAIRRAGAHSRIAPLDPAHEPADMDAAGEHGSVFVAAMLRLLRVVGPLRHEALQARQVEQSPRERGGFETFDIPGDILPSGIEGTEPGRRVGAAPALLDDF